MSDPQVSQTSASTGDAQSLPAEDTSGFSRRQVLGIAAGAAAVAGSGMSLLGPAGRVWAAPEQTSQITQDAQDAQDGSTIIFGDASSESAASLAQDNSETLTGAFGASARRILPPSGSLTFTLDCDPVQQNYLTVKMWGSDVDTIGSQLVLTMVNGSNVAPSYEYGQALPEIDRFGTGEAYPGRFIFSTVPLPLSLTTGSSQVALVLNSLGQATPYAPGQPSAPQTTPGRGIYSATVHTGAFFTPPGPSQVGTSPAGHPMSSPNGLSPRDYLIGEVETVLATLTGWQLYGPAWDAMVAQGAPASLTGAMVFGGIDALDPQPTWTEQQWKTAIGNPAIDSGNNVAMDYVTILAQAYLHDWSSLSGQQDTVDRVVAALDFFCIAQGANGGFSDNVHGNYWIGAPTRKNAFASLEGFGDRYLGQGFVLLQDQIAPRLSELVDNDENSATPQVTRGEAYRQMFLGLRTYDLATLNQGHAPNQDLAQKHAAWWANEALKILSPADALTIDDMLPSFHEAAGLVPVASTPFVTNQYWFSTKGIGLEAGGSAFGGYACDYGVNDVELLSELAAYTGDEALITHANKAIDALSYFFYRWVDGATGNQQLVDESVVAWRNNYDFPQVTYGGGSTGAAALILKHPVAIRQANLYIKDRRAYAFSAAAELAGNHTMDDTVEAVRVINNYAQLAALKQAPLLPMERSGDFAWADEQAAVVAVKHGKEKFFAVFHWRHAGGTTRVPSAAIPNNIGRVHYTTPEIDRQDTVMHTSTPGLFGLYQVSYGPYVVAMNASPRTQYEVTAPAGAKKWRDLISGASTKPGATVQLKPQTTIVWVQS